MASYSVAELTQGLNVVVVGDTQCQITGIATLKNARLGDLTFLSNPTYKKYLADTKASAVVLAPDCADASPTNTIVAANPYLVYAKIAEFFAQPRQFNATIDPTAIIGRGTTIAPNVSISANVVIGDNVIINAGVTIGAGSIIGNNCVIGSASKIDCRVTIYDHVIIGEQVEIASGTVLGSDGFGFANNNGAWYKVPQLGRVVIANNVAIGANCTIDRGAIEDTYLGEGVKLDNLVQIGHNVTIGAHTIIAGCVGIAGSVTIGKHCLIGGGVGISGHLVIADQVAITGMSAITKSIRTQGVYSSGVGGVVTNKLWRRYSARVHKLDFLAKKINSLEQNFAKMANKDEEKVNI